VLNVVLIDKISRHTEMFVRNVVRDGNWADLGDICKVQSETPSPFLVLLPLAALMQIADAGMPLRTGAIVNSPVRIQSLLPLYIESGESLRRNYLANFVHM